MIWIHIQCGKNYKSLGAWKILKSGRCLEMGLFGIIPVFTGQHQGIVLHQILKTLFPQREIFVLREERRPHSGLLGSSPPEMLWITANMEHTKHICMS
jgi:hypothetical protein